VDFRENGQNPGNLIPAKYNPFKVVVSYRFILIEKYDFKIRIQTHTHVS